MEAFKQSAEAFVRQAIEDKPKEITRKLETFKAEDEKTSVEDTVRANLRGFARTIPSFIMAYGDRSLTLANFDDYTEDDVFLEVTGITEDEFRFLRDGGDYVDERTGKTEHFAGGLFDETVFNDSVDELERENPGCFDDPTATFADLYMKSGIYITEIVKRLYASDGLRRAFPNDTDRICHIIEHQVYGMAPTRIIYLIATNYILGFDELMRATSTHFAQCDTAEAAKSGTLERVVAEHFG